MGITGSIIIYVMIWWIIFFSVLPIGIQSNKEDFKEKIGGVDPGAPINPRIIPKILIKFILVLKIKKDNITTNIGEIIIRIELFTGVE